MTLDTGTIARILIRHDPLGLYFGDIDNADEYQWEAQRIAEGAPACHSEESCLDLVWDVFRAQFGEALSGTKSDYSQISRELWRAGTSQSRGT